MTIARSRKHITTYYDTSEIGKFPTRNKPVSLASPLTEDQSLTYVEIADTLRKLNLSVYSPLKYILPSQISKYAQLYDKKTNNGRLTQFDRERSLKILMHINLLKRLESSVDSFRITTNGILQQVEQTIKSLEKPGLENLDSFQFDADDENFEAGIKHGEY